MQLQEVKMEQLDEFSKEIVDRYLKSMGYDPKHIDRDKRMAFTKTIRFQQYAQRMGEEVESNLSNKTLKVLECNDNLQETLKVGDDVAAQVNSASTVFGKVHRVGQTGVHIIVRGQKEPEFYPHKSVYPSSEYEKRNPNPYEKPQKNLKEAIDKDYRYKVHRRGGSGSQEWSHHEGDTYDSLDAAKRIVDNMKKGATFGTQHKITRVPRTKLAGPKGRLPEAKEDNKDSYVVKEEAELDEGLGNLKNIGDLVKQSHDKIRASIQSKVGMTQDQINDAGAKKIKDKWKNIGNEIVKSRLGEAKSSYTIYHPTYSAAVQHAHEHLKKKGLEISDDNWFHHVNSGPKKPGEGQTNRLDIPLHKDGKETKKQVHIQVHNRGNDIKNAYELNMYHEAMEFPQGDFDAKGTSTKVVGEKKMSKSAQLIKSIYKPVKEELYDHEKDDKDGTTYGKKPKMNVSKEETPHADDKTQAAAVLSGGTTLTGQPRDTVEIDPLLKKSKPGSPQDSGDDKNNK